VTRWGPARPRRARIMNLALFFEGTGQGVAGAYTNVTRLRDLCVEDETQRLHLEPGPGAHFGAYAVGALHGIGWRQIFTRAKKWFEQSCRDEIRGTRDEIRGTRDEIRGTRDEIRGTREKERETLRIFLFGFSRGALIARHFAEWLEPQGFEVAYLGLWDTVDSTINLDVSETCPSNVRAARHAIARDETRRFYSLVPLHPSQTSHTSHTSRTSHTSHTSQTCSQLVFPGSHSDVGGLYADNHVIADAALDWIAQGAVKAGLCLKHGVRLRHPRDFSAAVLHSEQAEVSNLWGAFDPVQRVLKGLRRHISCRACGRDCPNRVR